MLTLNLRCQSSKSNENQPKNRLKLPELLSDPCRAHIVGLATITAVARALLGGQTFKMLGHRSNSVFTGSSSENQPKNSLKLPELLSDTCRAHIVGLATITAVARALLGGQTLRMLGYHSNSEITGVSSETQS